MTTTSEGPHRVCRDAGGLVSEGGGREVVEEVGEGRGQRAVVLRGHDQEAVTLLEDDYESDNEECCQPV